ncbi:hypothetical protein ACRAWF_27755 [Streptomyces sp. L7]
MLITTADADRLLPQQPLGKHGAAPQAATLPPPQNPPHCGRRRPGRSGRRPGSASAPRRWTPCARTG